jgi:hypothetical protein
MSTIATMTSTVGEYQSGNTYRLRTKEASLFSETNKATILDTQPEPVTTIEGE